MDSGSLDYTPLTLPVSSREIRQHIKTTYLNDKSAKSTHAARIIHWSLVAVSAVIAVPLLLSILMLIIELVSTAGSAESHMPLISSVIVIGALGAGGYAVWRTAIRGLTKTIQLKRFAEHNKLTYLDSPPEDHPGLIFQPGHSKRLAPALGMADAGNLLFGNYQYTTGSGKNRKTHYFGFLCCQLSRKLPHVILDATSNNFMKRFSNLGNFGKNQRIELEGNFNQHFNVYCPEDYGRDTLYWLTPELMALLIDHMARYDIEVIDNYVYVYSRQFTLDEHTIRNLIGLGTWIYQEFEENTHRYADERIGSFSTNMVAEQGRRLKRRIPWVLVAIVIACIVYAFTSQMVRFITAP